ncbi:GIY-YIG nuclease family protein [Pectobacterium polaris]|uniref:GIY-YIG nuclease family protein n=1 Tax=Pectobacterium polaris TaxID=2042057 RepID=UPI0032ECEFED
MTEIEKWSVLPPTVENMDFPDGFTPNGWVYVLKNECMPGLFKVGMTTDEPNKRASQLSGTTGIPVKFEVVASFFSDDPCKHEKEIHKILARHRINENREFFQCPLDKILSACNSIIPNGTARKVNDLIDDYNLISFEKFGDYSTENFLSNLGISYFGDTRAVRDRLIMFGAEFVKHLTKDGGAVVFFDNQFTILKKDAGEVNCNE